MKEPCRVLLVLLLISESAAVEAQFSYTTNLDNTITITGYAGPPWAVVIPANTNGLPVTCIADNAFENLNSLTSVTIPGSVISIGVDAFYGGYGLTNVSILPGSGTSIGDAAFQQCTNLSSLTIPGSVTSIGQWAFSGCYSLTNVMIGNGATNIGYQAFCGCVGLISVTIPGSVASIGPYAFDECYVLKNATLSNGITSIGGGAFEQCSSLTNVTIPVSVTSIGDGAFSQCSSLTSVTIPRSITNIEDSTFAYCYNLTNVTIPSSVTYIGDYAFEYCTSLANVTIPGSVIYIGQAAFFSCSSLTGVYFTGNAPYVTPVWPTAYVFGSDNKATVYYLPSTTGWSSPFGNVAAVLWNPVIQTGDGSFGLRNTQFGFSITYTNNVSVVVEACTNLACPVWLPLRTVTLTNGSFHFSEAVQGNISGRFYGLGLP